MIKDIVVNLALGGTRDGARDYAVSVAAAFNAHLTGVAFSYEPFVPGTIFDSYTASLAEKLRAENEKAATAATEEFNEVVRKNALSGEPRIASTSLAESPDVFARIARRHDISIVAQTKPQSEFPDDLIIEAALFNSGRPVLVVPYIQSASLKLDRILVCWDGSRSAARAISDAMPFLERGKDIEIITVAVNDDRRDEIPGADMAQHLARHNLKVDLKRVVSPDIEASDTILSYAADCAADLIVMGGYGHSRLREIVLGGVTRGLLSSMTVPTLMSH